MDLEIPTTSTAMKPKRGRKPKRFNPKKRGRKPKNVRIKVEDEVPEVPDNSLEIEKILRKAEFVSSGGETKYLVSWPSTWEPEENIFCHDLLQKFKAGLPQSIETGDVNDDNDDNDEDPVWCVEQILEKQYDQDGKAEYLLKWQNSWVNAKDIRADLVQDFEDTLKLKRLMAMDSENARRFNNNNNDNDIDGDVQETLKRKRSISTDEMDEMEPSPKKADSGQKKMEEPKADSPRVIEMELVTSSEQRKLDRIIDIGKSNDGSFSFILQFETGELGIIKRQDANIKYPQEVIAFYQRRIQFF